MVGQLASGSARLYVLLIVCDVAVSGVAGAAELPADVDLAAVVERLCAREAAVTALSGLFSATSFKGPAHDLAQAQDLAVLGMEYEPCGDHGLALVRFALEPGRRRTDTLVLADGPGPWGRGMLGSLPGDDDLVPEDLLGFAPTPGWSPPVRTEIYDGQRAVHFNRRTGRLDVIHQTADPAELDSSLEDALGLRVGGMPIGRLMQTALDGEAPARWAELLAGYRLRLVADDPREHAGIPCEVVRLTAARDESPDLAVLEVELWLAPGLGYVPVRIDRWWVVDAERDRSAAEVYVAEGFTELVDGVWLPRRTTRHAFTYRPGIEWPLDQTLVVVFHRLAAGIAEPEPGPSPYALDVPFGAYVSDAEGLLGVTSGLNLGVAPDELWRRWLEPFPEPPA